MALPLHEAITVTLVPTAQEMQQLAGKQMQHHNLAALMAQNESLLAVVILIPHISGLATFVPADLRNVSCQSMCATKTFMLHSSCFKQAAAVGSCPDACLLLCLTGCMLLDARRKVDLASDFQHCLCCAATVAAA